MNTVNEYAGFRQTLIALAVLGTFGPAFAQDIGELTAPGGNSVSVGIGYATGDDKDRALFGLYNGLRNDNVHGLVGFEYNNLNSTGIWTNALGRNLGLDSRELLFSWNKPGDWKLNAGYSEITRQDPRTINTSMIGAGTTTPTIVNLATPGRGADVDLELKRKGLTLGGEKWFFGNNLQLQVNFKNEDKDGARQFGKGFACGTTWSAAGIAICTGTEWALLRMPEPVNSNIKQIDAKLNYNTDNLLLSGGYYGSFYTNDNGSLTPTISGALNKPLTAAMVTTMGLPVALPPDNEAHQLYLAGNYRFTPKTHATFKYSYTHGKQDEDFLSNGLTAAPAGVANLGGVVDTSRYQVGLTARPMPKLSLLADARYEDKDDKTPIFYYNNEGLGAPFTNAHNSHKRLNAKIEGSYQLPQNYRATLGVDYEQMDRGRPVATTAIAGLTALREKTDETGWRAELRKAMSESLTGALQYSSARRNGSDYTALTPGFPIVSAATLVATGSATNIVVPAMLMDRTRDKWKLSANWTPAERLDLQFFVENGKDRYSDALAPRASGGVAKGLRDTDMELYSLDAGYAMSGSWKLHAYYSHGKQTLHVNHSNGYMAALKDTNDSFGVGVSGKPSQRLKMGADLTYIKDKNAYGQALPPGGTTGAFLAYPLPDVTFDQTRLKLFGEYAVQKDAYVRLDLIHQRSKLDEWTWGYNNTPFVFTDNTTMTAQQTQTVTFVGATYVYKFR